MVFPDINSIRRRFALTVVAARATQKSPWIHGSGFMEKRSARASGPHLRAAGICLVLSTAASAGSADPAAPSASPPDTTQPVWTGVYEGRAYLTGDSIPAYSEAYRLRLAGNRPLHARTEYRDRGGRIIAVRTLDFSSHPWSPGYRFIDRRTGYEERAEPTDQGVRMFLRDASDEAPKQRLVRVPDPFVIDGGFSRFLRSHWDSLSAGARLRVNFVAVSRMNWYTFEAWLDDSATVVARPRNPALRLLVDPIRFTYDPATRRLVRYEGMANIRNPDGATPRVHLVFTPMRRSP